MLRKICLLFSLLVVVALFVSAVGAQDDTFSVTILHTNDVHGAYGPYDAADDVSTDGGAARQAAVINQIRAEGGNVLLMDGGDRFTGTLFHQQWRGEEAARIMNAIGYDVMTVGNHEFDNGDEVLGAFVDAIDFPIITANVTFGEDLAPKIQPYTVLEVGGDQIGVIGLTPPDTDILSSPGPDVTFSDDMVTIVQSAVDALTEQGINKIILVTHIGLVVDEGLVPQISGVDVIVGGHSHTLLSNSATSGEGAYPTVIADAAGNDVYIVQAGSSLRYLGRLDVTWDAEGVVQSASGDTIFLSRYITPDPDMLAIVNELRAPISELTAIAVGESSVFLVGDRSVCRVEECNIGNLITDAMREYSGAQIAITNGGGIRSNVPVGADIPADLNLATPMQVTLGDILTVFPFGNVVAWFELTGSDVIAALENGVSQVENGAGRFPQVSGIRYSWDGSKPAGERIVGVDVLGEDGTYSPIDVNATYTVVTNDFMRGGGDGYSVFAENAINPYDGGSPLDVVLSDYITANSPIAPAVEGRITRVDTPSS
jgi:5'-nucleotidase / UDP-sugar diphosphatase